MLLALLAAVAWTSLALKRPFTAEFARKDWDRAILENPLFIAINTGLTLMWGTIFVAGIVGDVLGWPPSIMFAASAVGIVASSFGPSRLVRWALARQVARQTPHRWPVPAPRRCSGDSGKAEGEFDVLVVGAGIGGLTAAALTAKESGLRVGVFERYTRPGGFCHSWTRKVDVDGRTMRFRFDGGVHDISGAHSGGTVDTVLRRLGKREAVEWLRMEQEHILPGLRFRVPPRLDELTGLLARQFPAESGQISVFFATMDAVRSGMYATARHAGGVPSGPRSVDEALRLAYDFPEMVKWIDRPFQSLVTAHLSDPRLRAAVNALAGYLTDKPERLTVGEMAPIFGYYANGGYYPKGGSQRLANVLVRSIKENGGSVHLGRGVARILVEHGRAAGIETEDGARLRAPVVISNADLDTTLNKLLAPQDLPARFRRRFGAFEPSTSAFSVQLGLDFVPDCAPILLARDQGGMRLGISVPSLADPSRAPDGGASVSLLSFLPADRDGRWRRDHPSYGAAKRAIAEQMIDAAERIIPGLRGGILLQEEASPATYARYAGTYGGQIYGPALGQARPPRKSPIPGLFLAGSAVFPGAGVEAVMISGALVARDIEEAVRAREDRRSRLPYKEPAK